MSFDILLRDININQHILCEASAGTGKTFTIEHLFIRRLIGSPQCSVRDIAVLTFTNAVASELVLRLKRALDKAIVELRSKNEKSADYLLAVIQQGQADACASVLEVARDELEFASIDTMHGFCYKCLSEYATGVLKADKGKFASGTDIGYCIEEFFRVGLKDDIITQSELQVLLKIHRRDFSYLKDVLSTTLWNDEKIGVRSVPEIKKSVEVKKCLELKNALPTESPSATYTPDALLMELLDASFHFNHLRSRDGELKEDIARALNAAAHLAKDVLTDEDIASIIKDPLFTSEVFSEPKAKSSHMVFACLDFLKALEPLIHELAHPNSILKRIRAKCKKFVSSELERRGLYSVQELLIRMQREIKDIAFQAYLKKRFSCVIVDEFQDTDPYQWDILHTLFVQNWHGFLYLVGDPKQAIYSFRQADVYCYMQAKTLENQAVVTLSRNFRSSPDLVEGLNTLFRGPHTPLLFVLPKLNISLDVPEILSGGGAENLRFNETGAIHFFKAMGNLGRKKTWPTEEIERDIFFPFIAHELKRLKIHGISYSGSAILVKDRFQAQRIEGYLTRRGIPTLSWRKKSIVNSPAHQFLQRLMACLVSVRDLGRLIDLVVQPPFSYSSEKCLKLHDNLEFWAEHVTYLLALKHRFEKSQVAGLVQAFLNGMPPPHALMQCQTMKQQLWADKDFLFDLELLVELCQDYVQSQFSLQTSLESVQEYLHTLSRFSQTEQDQLMSRYDPQKEAVQILTIFASKGLEFDIVFGLGLVNRTQEPELHADPVELDNEKVRQFYVACTRAKRKLYLPVATQEDISEVPPGRKAPMELFLQTTSLEWLLEHGNKKISCENLVASTDTSFLEAPLQDQKEALTFAALPYQPLHSVLTSFTKLNESQSKKFTDTQYELSATYPNQLSNQLSNQLASEKQLPAGIEAGILFHELLEELLQDDCLTLTDTFLQKRLVASVFEGFEEEVFAVLEQALKVKLNSFSLCDVDRRKCLVEKIFVCPHEGNRFVQGAVDLFFEYQGKFYLLDWKSNLLENYSKAALQQEVLRHGYDLQAKIYTQACRRFLQSRSADYGGFFFVFLRGLKDPESHGVLFLQPDVLNTVDIFETAGSRPQVLQEAHMP